MRNIILYAQLSQDKQPVEGVVTPLDACVSVDAVINKQHEAVKVVGVEAH